MKADMRVHGLLLVLLWSNGVIGCDSSSLEDEEHARTWANTASAVGVYAHVHDPFAFADGQLPLDDANCPQTSDDGTTATLVGGCTDASGVAWEGRATIVRSPSGSRALTLDAYAKIRDPELRSTTSGTAELTPRTAQQHDFRVDIVVDGGVTTTIDYAGSVAGDYGMPTVWNGRGTVERDGLVEPTGAVHATTVDERLDEAVCSGQAVSGSTSIAQDDESLLITYDGALDCDDDAAARWSVNGKDRGLITGITCAHGRSSNPWGAALLLAMLMGMQRRRMGS